MRKLRLRENKLFPRAYKANTIGARANSYSGQMKSWNSRCEVSTGTCGTSRQVVGVRVMGEAGQRVVSSPAICYMDHSIWLLAFQPSTKSIQLSQFSVILSEIYEAPLGASTMGCKGCPWPQRAYSPKWETDTKILLIHGVWSLYVYITYQGARIYRRWGWQLLKAY